MTRIFNLSFTSSFKPLFTGLAIATLSAACTSTEVISDEPKTQSNNILLSVAPPANTSAPTTRSHNGMKLRYTAKLFSGSQPSRSGFKGRSEMLAAEAVEKQFVFSADETGEYCIALFADYIDADAVADGNGHYPDKHYDTTSETDATQMLGMHSKENHTSYDTDFINNDNFDAFFALHKLTKTANAYEGNCTLKRAVCKIRICAKESALEGVDKITLSKLSYLSELSHTNGKSGVQNNVSDGCLPKPFSPNGGDDKEIFWFYSFGSIGTGIGEIAFSVSGMEGWEFKDVSIPPGIIKGIEPNKVYKITGNFIQSTNSPSEEIRINVSHDDTWSQEIINFAS